MEYHLFCFYCAKASTEHTEFRSVGISKLPNRVPELKAFIFFNSASLQCKNLFRKFEAVKLKKLRCVNDGDIYFFLNNSRDTSQSL
jgi:hypothetical protein